MLFVKFIKTVMWVIIISINIQKMCNLGFPNTNSLVDEATEPEIKTPVVVNHLFLTWTQH